MKISVFGLGYVGAVSAGCLAQSGHEVVGIDPAETKVDLINRGQSPVIEAEIRELIASNVISGRLRATTDATQAILDTDLSFVCVGTPSQVNGNLDLRFIRRVCEQIGATLKLKSKWHTVVIRSTVLPGTMRSIVIPILEEFSEKKAGGDFGVCHNPEFLREGSAVKDFNAPPKDGDRRSEPSQWRSACCSLWPPRCSIDEDDPRNRRDGQIRRQQLACIKDRLCK